MRYKVMRGFVLKVLYPLLMFVAAFLKGKKTAFQSIIIRLNNNLVEKESGRGSFARQPASGKEGAVTPPRLLLLLPHCLQVDECKIRLTHNIRNCERCGKCEIRDLIGIAEKSKIELFVATGGNLARRIVGEVNPYAVVAVACENDLSSGIADTYPLPVLGVMNERPFGPCVNTRVDLKKIEEAVLALGPLFSTRAD